MKILIIILSIFSFGLIAQQDIQNSFYMFNPSVLNPAYVGSRDALSILVDYRNQWSGWKGAPKTCNITAHTPLVNDAIGIGFNITQERIGPSDMSRIFADYAYRIKLNKNNDRLCFGLRAGLNIIKNRYADLEIVNSSDPILYSSFNVNLFNFGSGIYYYGKRHYVGLTIPEIIPLKASVNQVVISRQVPHAYLIGGYIWSLNSLWQFKPSVCLKYALNAPITIDGNVSFLFNEKIWFGLMYRYGNAVGANFVYQITTKMRLGYAYDYSLTNMGRYNPNTHEIMIGFDFNKPDRIIKSPRYF